jgi:hypothetical protein
MIAMRYFSEPKTYPSKSAYRRLGERYRLCFVQLTLVIASRSSSCLSLAGDLEVES